MTLEELEDEMKTELFGNDEKHLILRFAHTIPEKFYNKEAIITGLREIRERMLLRIDDLICWAREEDK